LKCLHQLGYFSAKAFAAWATSPINDNKESQMKISINKKKTRTLVLPLALKVMDSAMAQEVAVATFQPPDVETRVTPSYPALALQDNEEGSVEINLMVDTSGKPFEINVRNATGDKQFQRAAINAIENWTFKPAMMNGEPIVGSHRMIMRFHIEGNTGARSKFVGAYRRFTKSLAEESQPEAEKKLTTLVAASGYNQYENAFLNLGQYMYAQKYGTSVQQMEYLDAALSFSRDKEDLVYLPDESAKMARRELMRLQAENKRYSEALKTYRYFAISEDAEAEGIFKPIVAQILALAKDDRSYAVAAALDDSGSFELDLLKHHIYFTGAAGKISEFKLRCSQNYVGFVVEPEVAYNIPEAWGSCALEIVGDAGATLSLIQQ
jgi:TonB family protein